MIIFVSPSGSVLSKTVKGLEKHGLKKYRSRFSLKIPTQQQRQRLLSSVQLLLPCSEPWEGFGLTSASKYGSSQRDCTHPQGQAQHTLLTARCQGGCKDGIKALIAYKKMNVKNKRCLALPYCLTSPIKTAYRNDVEASSTAGQTSRILRILY